MEAGLGVVIAASEAATLLTLALLLTMPSAQVCSPERSNTTASSALLTFPLKLYKLNKHSPLPVPLSQGYELGILSR